MAESYKMQFHTETDMINVITETGSVQFRLTPFLNGLKECGYQIKNPPPQFLKDAHYWLLKHWGDCIREHTSEKLIAIKMAKTGDPRQMRLDILENGTGSLQIWNEDSHPVFVGEIATFEDFINAFRLTQSI